MLLSHGREPFDEAWISVVPPSRWSCARLRFDTYWHPKLDGRVTQQAFSDIVARAQSLLDASLSTYYALRAPSALLVLAGALCLPVAMTWPVWHHHTVHADGSEAPWHPMYTLVYLAAALIVVGVCLRLWGSNVRANGVAVFCVQMQCYLDEGVNAHARAQRGDGAAAAASVTWHVRAEAYVNRVQVRGASWRTTTLPKITARLGGVAHAVVIVPQQQVYAVPQPQQQWPQQQQQPPQQGMVVPGQAAAAAPQAEEGQRRPDALPPSYQNDTAAEGGVAAACAALPPPQ